MSSPRDQHSDHTVADAIEAAQEPVSRSENQGDQSTGASATGAAVAAAEDGNVRVGRYRWVICALLFFATTVNYVDRLVFGILGPELQKTFGWTEGNPITYLLKYLAFGEGDTAPVTREVLRQAEPDVAKRPRIHVG